MKKLIASLRCPRPVVAICAAIVLALGVGLTAMRVVRQYQTPGPFNPNAQGMCDFHNGIYFPTRALLQGVSPYSQHYADTKPVARQIPFFSPVILVLHAPLAVLPLHVAECVFFVFSVAMVIVLASLAVSSAGLPGRVDWILAIAALMVYSRGGHITLFDGYFTLELVLASWLAVHWADKRPWWSALALVVVSAKPTFILPLGFLMLARGNFKPLVIGAVFSLIGAALPLAWLVANYADVGEGAVDWTAGIEALRTDIETTQQVHMNMEDETPVNSWTRLDLLAIVAKWANAQPSQATHLLVMGGLLIPPMLLLGWRRVKGIDDGIAGVTGGVLFLAMIVSLYHQSYDALLVVAPLVGILGRKLAGWRRFAPWNRGLIALMLLGALFNYLSTRLFLGRWELEPPTLHVFTSLSGACLAVALLMVCIGEFRRIVTVQVHRDSGQTHVDSSGSKSL